MKRFKMRYVSFLLVATFAVAAPRYMGVFGLIVGEDLTKTWPLFKLTEIWSGLAMGALEALVLDYIMHRLKRISLWSPYWWVSAVMAGIILVSFPFVTAPYMMALMNGVTIAEVLNGSFAARWVFWGWTFLVASLVPLIVAAIGIVRDEATSEATRPFGRLVRLAQAQGILERWEQDNGRRTPTVMWLRSEFANLVGAELAMTEADEAILEWRSVKGINGRRPEEREKGS